MTGWIVWGGILLLFVLLLSQSIVIRAEKDSSGFRAFIGIGPFRKRLLPSAPADSPWEQDRVSRKEQKAKRKKDRKAAKNRKPAAKKAKKDGGSPKKREAGDVAGMVQLVLEAAKGAFPPLKKIAGGFRLTALRLYIRVGGADAAQTARLYGQVCALVHGSLATLKNFMRIKITDLGIGYDFLNSGITEEFSFKLKLRLSRALGQLIRLLWRVLRRTFRLLLKQMGRPSSAEKKDSEPAQQSTEPVSG